ncbi:hypothetical protein [Streptomyces sp. G1]|uniref:hypothetical protein n=1 Tax=Streptomyces sp. G1 TaxID=361572 RepID=UPI002030F67C|nr:hypothetical protein [Streptomyces sp. G1]MCM1974526.1 hypothetical protein [Streptomyces sp. G1]
MAAAGLVWALTFEGEPPAAETAPISQAPTAQTSAGTAGPLEVKRVIVAAPQVGVYQLLAGAEAAEYDELTSERQPSGKRWFYDGPGERPVGAILQINTVEWDPRLAKNKTSDTTTQELRNFFAGCRATEVTAFGAGPWDGKSSCGFLPSAGHPIVCAWTAFGTFGSVLLADEQGLPKAAEVARQFRTASEKRT